MPSSDEVVVACILLQNDEAGRGHPIYYSSRLLAPYELKYSSTEKLAVTLMFTCSKFKHYLLSSSFPVEVQCAQEGLRYLIQQANLTGRAARFAIALQQFDLMLKGVKGQRALQAKVLLELGKPQPSREGALTEDTECCLLENEVATRPSC
jgi:hypothetical protein